MDTVWNYALRQFFDLRFERFTYRTPEGVIYRWRGGWAMKTLCSWLVDRGMCDLARRLFEIWIEVL